MADDDLAEATEEQHQANLDARLELHYSQKSHHEAADAVIELEQIKNWVFQKHICGNICRNTCNACQTCTPNGKNFMEPW